MRLFGKFCKLSYSVNIMWHRFFKLVYGILLAGIIVFIPINFIINSSNYSYRFVQYKVKCSHNNKYVVLQGSKLDEYATYSNATLDKREMNFYCKFYSEIQFYIADYLRSNNKIQSNLDYFDFKAKNINKVGYYPELFTVEKQYDEFFYRGTIFDPLLVSLTLGGIFFVGLQVLKNFYTYIKFGTWTIHPFRTEKKKKAQ